MKSRMSSKFGKIDGIYRKHKEKHRITEIRSRDVQIQPSSSCTRVYGKQKAQCSCSFGQVGRGSRGSGTF